MDSIKGLIEAMVIYGLEHCWTDNDIIEQLVDCGIKEEDFRACGYGDFVEAYFAED